MSKPKIYGTCPAGCLWETVHKEDFEKSASLIPQYPDENGRYYFTKGKDYKIICAKTANEDGSYSFARVLFDTGNQSSGYSLNTADKYADAIVFRFLDSYKGADELLHLVYEVGGVRYEVADENISADAPAVYAFISAADGLSVFLYNADATIKAEKGEKGADAEVVDSIGESETAAMSQAAITRELKSGENIMRVENELALLFTLNKVSGRASILVENGEVHNRLNIEASITSAIDISSLYSSGEITNKNPVWDMRNDNLIIRGRYSQSEAHDLTLWVCCWNEALSDYKLAKYPLSSTSGDIYIDVLALMNANNIPTANYPMIALDRVAGSKHAGGYGYDVIIDRIYKKQDEANLSLKETLNGVKQLQSAFNEFKAIRKIGRNVFNPATASVGYKLKADGVLEADSGYITSDFIPYRQGQPIRTINFYNGTYNNGGLVSCAFYDSEKNLLEYPDGFAAIMWGKTPNIAYVRITTLSFYLNCFVAVIGDTNTDDITEYIPYEEYNEYIPKNETPRRKKVLVTNGDSITYGHRPSTSEYPNCYNDMIPKISYVDELAHVTGCDLRKYAISSSCLALNSDGTNTHDSLVERYALMNDGADVVLIAIGSNDWAFNTVVLGAMTDRVKTTFYGALHILCQGLKVKYPTAYIVFSTPIKRATMNGATYTGNTNTEGKTIEEYCDAIKEVCGYYSIAVMDMEKECGVNAWEEFDRTTYILDGIHPNEKGQKKMSQVAIRCLRTLLE